MVGVRETVAGGRIDERFLDAARDAARLVTRTRPAPTGASPWSDEDIDDLVLETVTRVEPSGVVLAAQGADNDTEFAGWLRKALRTTLDLRARGTPSGRVIRAMDDALREDPDRFQLNDGRWRLVADDRDPTWKEGRSPLVEVAWSVETTTVRMSKDAMKTPPMAHRHDIRTVCAAVLDLSGPLLKVELAEVLAHRFNVAFEDRFDYLDLDDEDHHAQPAATAAHEALEGVDDELAAHWMLGQLTGEERRMLGTLLTAASLRDLAATLGCTKYRAELVRDRLQQKLRRLADLVPGGGEAATARLLELVGQHEELRHSTEHDGADDGH